MKNGPYELIVPPPEYPGKRYRGKYAYEHRVRYWQEHGTLPPVVHHDNEKKRDNHPKNLVGQTRGEHSGLHNRERRNPDVKLVCGWCGKKFTRRHNKIQYKIDAGQTMFYCSQDHGGRARRTDLKHGYRGYKKGCRCDVCRAGQTRHNRLYRRNKKSLER